MVCLCRDREGPGSSTDWRGRLSFLSWFFAPHPALGGEGGQRDQGRMELAGLHRVQRAFSGFPGDFRGSSTYGLAAAVDQGVSVCNSRHLACVTLRDRCFNPEISRVSRNYSCTRNGRHCAIHKYMIRTASFDENQSPSQAAVPFFNVDVYGHGEEAPCSIIM